MSIEKWRPVIGFDGFYEVSNLGQVRSVARWAEHRGQPRLWEGQLRRLSKGDHGYLKVVLIKDGEHVTKQVHRIVAEAFVPGSGPVVRHLDGNQENNCSVNLAWGTYSDNEADKARHGRTPRGEGHSRSKLNDEIVRAIRGLHSRGFTQLKIASHLGINRGVVGNVVRGEAWIHVA